MSYGIRCGVDGCPLYAGWRYKWPGQEQAAVCDEHKIPLCEAANKAGLFIMIFPLTSADHQNLHHPLRDSRVRPR